MHLARLMREKFPLPLGFVIPCSLFDTFVTESGLERKLPEIYGQFPQTIEGYARAYKEVLAFFHSVQFSDNLKEQLIEAYESLALPSKGADAHTLINSHKDPAVIIIPSPDYILHKEDLLGVQMNVQGKEQFLQALKLCWASAFLPEQVLQRQQFTIKQFSFGIIVEQQQKSELQVRALYQAKDDVPVTIATYIGYLDILGEIPANTYRIAPSLQEIYERTLAEQQYKLVPDVSGSLEQCSISAKHELTEKQILDFGRLVKKAAMIFHHEVTLFFSLQGNNATLMLVLLEQRELTIVMEPSPEPAPLPDDGYITLDKLGEQDKKEELEETIPPTITDSIDDHEENKLPAQQGFQIRMPALLRTEEVPPVVPVPEAERLASEQEKVREETLFDLVADKDPHPAIAFVEQAMHALECEMVMRYLQFYHKEPEGYADLITKLREASLLPVSEQDLSQMEFWHEQILKGKDPSDYAIGLAWRILHHWH
jgi:hypothetical protein